eukprot:COSAG06_NODE_29804_length_550_cov_0.844789_1_plen_165_part_10
MATNHIEHSIEPRAGAECECTAATSICSTHVFATSTNEYCAPVMMCELSGGALLDGAEGGTVCACEKVYVSEYNAPTTPEVVVDVISDVCLEVSTPVDEGDLGAGVWWVLGTLIVLGICSFAAYTEYIQSRARQKTEKRWEATVEVTRNSLAGAVHQTQAERARA